MTKNGLFGALALTTALTSAAGIAAAEDTLKLGYIGGLTGYLAPYDQPSLAGVEVAVDEINKAGGIGGTMPIELIVRDMRSETAQAFVVAQELVDEGIDVLITPCDVDPSIAAGQVAQAAEVPAVTSCASTPTLPGVVGDYMFSNYPADNLQAAVLAQYATEQGYKTAYVLLSPETPYTERLPEYFMVAFEAMGGKILGVTEYSMGQQDFSAEVTKISGLDALPDVIMTAAYEPDFPAFLTQLRNAGIDTPVLGSDGIDSPTTLGLGPIAEGVVFTNAGYADEGSDLAAFYDAFETFHGSAAESAFTATGYDIVKVIAQAVQDAGSTDGPAIRDAWDAVKDVPGATGTITFAGGNRVPLRAVALNKVTGGELDHVGTFVPDAASVPGPDEGDH
ncbi:ABC transporter substrate-binding protein [Chachezhania sediminis]|uniref:ABC transporter substrate-binding protein n=1 Tax=Chachezhania sediminis TaxID=2599291 RepID=UPI00131C49B3|nr:ABC transporter substrate-binding protein [Chachezhania sediminis]